ncbi:GntR family transcriptional regulator [Microbacterium stercoris]|uniref:GntR family transcriptional regulator n=1 Tax=Microbacterium stercoris TaxID=2820289 RepID=A0A939TPN2_9MICO|nr:GntR family transcriptional regulator [Microbacterium stercoris]MBO3662580.1 GntR family transcriptional regulator [Microbacterium stercoris]
MSLPLGRVVEIERRGLRDRVYDLILEMLLRGEVEPGARLSIDSMARMLDVSPTPVREAMVQLERTGLVTREALRGYRVAPPLGPDELEQLFDARVVIESAAAGGAVKGGSDAVRSLREAHAGHVVAADEVVATHTDAGVPLEVTKAYFAADGEFHRQLFVAAGNHYLLEMHDGLGALTHRMRQALLTGPDDVREAVAEHEAILHAVEAGDADAAVARMREHLAQVRQRSLRDSTH